MRTDYRRPASRVRVLAFMTGLAYRVKDPMCMAYLNELVATIAYGVANAAIGTAGA